MTEAVYIGVDGGGTGTKLVCIDQNLNILARYEGPGTNWNYVGKSKVKSTLLYSLKCLLRDANRSASQVTRICLSIAGVHTSDDQKLYIEWIAPRFESAGIFVCNDVYAALASGTNGILQGAVCIAGTGMNCFGRNSRNEEANAGGMGPLLGDIGSGFYIGEQVLIACVRANDRRGQITSLLDAVVEQFKWTSFDQIIHWRYDQAGSADVSALAVLCFEHAEKGDLVAKRILDSAANGLSECICTVVQKLWRQGEQATVVTAGSVWKNQLFRNLVDEKVQHEMRNSGIQVTLKNPDVDAAYGAALIAHQMKDLKPSILELDSPIRKIGTLVKGVALVGGLIAVGLSMKTFWNSKKTIR